MSSRRTHLVILVAALGYFVDIYDIILFSVVRAHSLRALGVPESQLLEKGVLLINMQMGGMLVGGILWGMLGDRRGRLSVLFGSILMYSAANIANGLVHGVGAYAVVRFIAGVGLAGELGAGVTLVAEMMSKETRGLGTTIVAGVGVCGAAVAALVGDRLDWRTSYFIGGGLGIALLLLRIGVAESGMFEAVKARNVRRGDFWGLFANRARTRRYLAVILVGVPIWYAIGVLVTFAPEIGRAMGMAVLPVTSKAVLYTYVGLAIGDLGSGVASQLLRSRKRVVFASVLATAVTVVAYFVIGRRSLAAFYACCLALGITTGYWAMFVTIASEQFGTNVRATVTTTVPNFVRGAVVPMTLLFQAGKSVLGVQGSAIAVGAVVMTVALLSLRGIDETYGRDLDFVE